MDGPNINWKFLKLLKVDEKLTYRNYETLEHEMKLLFRKTFNLMKKTLD